MNPLAELFGAIVGARNALYDSGMFRVERLRAPVVSIGNISLGGAGKTPMVITLGRLLQQQGIEFDILSRGYGRTTTGALEVPIDGDPREYGDEPVMMREALNVPVYVGERRIDAGRLAERDVQRLHLLDDGFQHRKLARDFDIVVLSLSDFNDQLLPAGRLRETLRSLQRADAAIVPYSWAQNVPHFYGPVWRFRRRLDFHPQRPRRAVSFCGIARPQQFLELLERYEIEVPKQVAFRDHHLYTEQDLRSLLTTADGFGVETLVTTAKDEVKLRKLPSYAELKPRLCVAELATEIEDAGAVLSHIIEKVRQRHPGWFS